MADLQHALDVALEAAFAAGRRTLAHFGTGVAVEYKEDATPVTVADRDAEQVLRAHLGRAFPDHGVVGEEEGADRADASHVWWLDPIDGTKSFVRGVPLYGVLVALAIEGRVEVGVAHFPALGMTVSAASGLGTRLDGRPVRVRATDRLADAFVGFTDAGSFARHGRAGAWDRVRAATAFQAGWGDAYGHALVASGRLEVMLDPVMNAWDCGPFPVLLREAGGRFGDWRGRETIHGGEALSVSEALWPQLEPLLGEREST
ncbi:MAG: histidinol phosphate phosphatase [Trueperaceae bacterium]|nr:histidinol phosphate phosphatase [Trueperaceae bacterium]